MISNSSTQNVNEVLFKSLKKIVYKKGLWLGTMTDLNLAVGKTARLKAKVVSASPSVLRLQLNKVVNRLRNAGLSVRFYRSPDKARTRLVKFSVSN